LGTILAELANLGLDGVEAYHVCHEPRAAKKLHQRARDMGLLVTGGSDYHGGPPEQEKEEFQRLGKATFPPEEWERFATALLSKEGHQP
jgi:predicted metal-dependent phosphoesterase TrpH